MKRNRIIEVTVIIFVLSLTTFDIQATAQSAQDSFEETVNVSMVQVETLALEPTVVKTGDVITQTYRVRFFDLINEGKEIIILEDRMAPENLPVDPFEGISLDVEKRKINGEYIWNFMYGFRLINSEKSTYTLPGFSFYYLVRDLGQDLEEVEVQQVSSSSGLVRYVTTLTEVPVLDIRDTIDLGNFSGRAKTFRVLAWMVAPLPLLVWVVMLVRTVRIRRSKMLLPEAKQDEMDELERLEAQIPQPPSIWEARKNLHRKLKSLEELVLSTNGKELYELKQNLIIAIREYLQAELPELYRGDTPKDIKLHIDDLKDGVRKESLCVLVNRLIDYQNDLELETMLPIDEPSIEACTLRDALRMLRPHIQLWTHIKGILGFG